MTGKAPQELIVEKPISLSMCILKRKNAIICAEKTQQKNLHLNTNVEVGICLQRHRGYSDSPQQC